jgi:hypothetical protein
MVALIWVVGIGVVSNLWISVYRTELEKPRKITVFVRNLFDENWSTVMYLQSDGTIKAPENPEERVLCSKGSLFPTVPWFGFPNYKKEFKNVAGKRVAIGVTMDDVLFPLPINFGYAGDESE